MNGYVYLLHDPGMFKVGQTSDLEERRRKYKTHNPKVQWVGLMEVMHPIRTETRVLRELRQYYKQVAGTRDWFHGILAENAFYQMVQQAVAKDDVPEIAAPSIEQFLCDKVFGHLNGTVPLQGLLWDAADGGGLEWAEYITSLTMSVNDLGEVTVSLPSFSDKMILLTCGSEDLSVLEFVELIGNPVLNMMDSRSRETLIPLLHDLPARDLLDGNVVVDLVDSCIKD